MRAALYFLAVISVVYINAEDCPTNSVTDCTHLQCTDGYTLTCVNFICTCNPPTDTGCTSLSQCLGAGLGDCPVFQSWHCIDGTCRCTWDFDFGGIGK